MEPFIALAAIVFVVWILGCVAGLLGSRWCTRAHRKEMRRGILAAIIAAAIGLVGMTRIQVAYTQTVDGSGWTIESRWFFVVPLLLGLWGLALAFRRWRQQRVKS